MATRTKTLAQTAYFVERAGYLEGYTGKDHLLPKGDFDGMAGRSYLSAEEVKAELSRRATTIEAPCYAVVGVVRITQDHIRSAWLRRANEEANGGARLCRRLADEGDFGLLRISRTGRVTVEHETRINDCEQILRVVEMGHIGDYQIDRLTIRD